MGASARLEQARHFLVGIPRRELWALTGAMVLAVLLVLAYVIATRPNELAGDQGEYHSEGVFFTQGKLWWSTLPFGQAHASMWKAPGYPAWVGVWYEAVGSSPIRVAIVQGFLLAPLTVALTWVLGRRLFGPAVAIAAAFVVAVFPLVWEFYGGLYAEALAIPLTVLALLLFLERPPTRRLAVCLGVVVGAGILVRPTSFFLLGGIAAAWVIAAGWQRGLGFAALTTAIAALVVAPWTIRNAIVADGWVPISIQDAAGFGTFNDEAANDPVNPYAWRFQLENPPAVIEGPPVGDAEFRSELQDAAFDYIREHPFSVVEAFFWNGLSRTWDVRRPARALDEAPFEGRVKGVTAVGLAMYYVLLALALVALWRWRGRRALVIPVLITALACSVVFTIQSGTRYRAPLEPLIAVLAMAAIPALTARRTTADGAAEAEPAPRWAQTAAGSAR